jgi:hypothetical protein
MRLAFTTGLMRTTHFDDEMRQLADRHYSRRTVGTRQFLYSGKKLVLRDAAGLVLFGWMYPQESMRMDGMKGYNCAIFRNESTRKASDIILEAEYWAFEKWGPNRLYTYIDPAKTKVIKYRGRRIVGFSFIKAGWKPLIHKDGKPRISLGGKHILIKLWHGDSRLTDPLELVPKVRYA